MSELEMLNKIYLLIGEGDEGSTIWCDHIPDDDMDAVEYLRAEPIKALLGQARDALTSSNNALMDYIQTIESNGSSLYYGRKVFEDNRQTIASIDAALNKGEKK